MGLLEDLKELGVDMDKAWKFAPHLAGYGPVTWCIDRNGGLIAEWNFDLAEPVFGPPRPFEIVVRNGLA